MKRIAIIPGDGIGVEVTREAVRVLETVSRLLRRDAGTGPLRLGGGEISA